MFKIRRKKKNPLPSVSQDPALIVSAKLTVRALLNAVAVILKCQIVLAQHSTLWPDQGEAFATLIQAELTPSLAHLIEHARRRGFITDAQASELLAGTITEIDGALLESEASRAES